MRKKTKAETKKMSKETVRPKASKKRKGSLLKWLVGAVCLYILISFVQLQAEIKDKKTLVSEIEQKCEDQRSYNEQIQEILDQQDDEEYIERIAREKMGYAYPDERVYIDISGI